MLSFSSFHVQFTTEPSTKHKKIHIEKIVLKIIGHFVTKLHRFCIYFTKIYNNQNCGKENNKIDNNLNNNNNNEKRRWVVYNIIQNGKRWEVGSERTNEIFNHPHSVSRTLSYPPCTRSYTSRIFLFHRFGLNFRPKMRREKKISVKFAYDNH